MRISARQVFGVFAVGSGFRHSGREFAPFRRGKVEFIAAKGTVVGEGACDEPTGMAPRIVLEKSLVQPHCAVCRVEAGVRGPDDDEHGLCKPPVEIGLDRHVVEVAGGGEAGKERGGLERRRRPSWREDGRKNRLIIANLTWPTVASTTWGCSRASRSQANPA
jgi:hypothetical protein